MDNPSVTPADVISDVEGRFASSPALSSSRYMPWVSYGYQRTFNALSQVGQKVRENLFGELATLSLNTTTPNEYDLTTEIPRFGGFIKVEVKYGATGDVYNQAGFLSSLSHWNNQDNVSTTYRSKLTPLYYKLGNTLGFIPVPPESGALAKVWYIKRPSQLTDVADVIDIPYRFLYPLYDYVHARALQAVNEDYSASSQIESNFRLQLEEIQQSAASEFNEHDGSSAVEVNASDVIVNPFDY